MIVLTRLTISLLVIHRFILMRVRPLLTLVLLLITRLLPVVTALTLMVFIFLSRVILRLMVRFVLIRMRDRKPLRQARLMIS